MASPLNFNGGVTLSFQCKNRKVSAEWYQSMLGLKLLYDVAEIGWCEVSTETPGLNLGFAETPDPRVGSGPVPTFGVKDIDTARKMLEGKGVRFDGETRTIPGMVKLATFFDPDGNALMFFQDLQKMS